MSAKGESRQKNRRRRSKLGLGEPKRIGSLIRAPYMPTKVVKPKKWKQPKWHRDLFGAEQED